MTRRVLLRINDSLGGREMKAIALPESFNEIYDRARYMPVGYEGPAIPFIGEFKVEQFAARCRRGGKWTDLPFTYKYESFERHYANGEVSEDQRMVFHLQGLAAGDTIEYYYEAYFVSRYGSNLFFFASRYPKGECRYDFTYRVDRAFTTTEFILPVNVPAAAVTGTINPGADKSVITKSILLKDLPRVNYPQNAFAAGTLPHVFADFRYYRRLAGSYPVEDIRVYDIQLTRPPKFQWVLQTDTSAYMRVYDRQHSSVSRFLRSFPPVKGDSARVVFLKNLCDTFNSFRFVSARTLYNNPALSRVNSGDHLLKRRLVEGSLWKVYRDIFNESRIFYYGVNVLDNRFGEHSSEYRAHYAFEGHLLAVPHFSSFLYIMPRYNGLSYHLNELPFYYENGWAMFSGRNFQDTSQFSKGILFRKTPASTYVDNSRSESAVVKVGGGKASMQMRAALSGQFSTLLRPLYLGGAIDSSVARHYFRRSVDKPGASDISVAATSASHDYPFRYTFSCRAELPAGSDTALSLNGWFSFLAGSDVIPEEPRHDYFFDFAFTDSYNFSVEFDQPTEIVNGSEFSRKIVNAHFGLQSEVVPGGGNSYVVRVKLVVKQRRVPLADAPQLMELVKALDELAGFSLKLRPKI